MAVEIAVGAAVGEGAADLVLALGDGANAVDAGAGRADVAAYAAVVGVGQEVGSTASRRRSGNLLMEYISIDRDEVEFDEDLLLPSMSRRWSTQRSWGSCAHMLELSGQLGWLLEDWCNLLEPW